MKAIPSKSQISKSPQPEAPLKVVFAYADDAAFQAAMEIYRGVTGRLTAQFEFRNFSWRFGALTKLAVFERAVSMATGADVVFCCPASPHVLPRLVQDWIQQWITRRTQPDGALALLLPIKAGSSIYPTLLERDLRETARVAGLAFFATNYVANYPLHPALSLAKSPSAIREDMDVVRVFEHGADVDHWGINE